MRRMSLASCPGHTIVQRMCGSGPEAVSTISNLRPILLSPPVALVSPATSRNRNARKINTATEVTAPLWGGKVASYVQAGLALVFAPANSDGTARARGHRLPRLSGTRRTRRFAGSVRKAGAYPMLTAVVHDRPLGICRSAGTIRFLARLLLAQRGITDAHSQNGLPAARRALSLPEIRRRCKACQVTYSRPYWARECFSKRCHVLSARGQPGTVIAD
ncbi:hypothetical protein ABIC09_006771 [Bradyrhizobium sp. S3.12.5]